MNTSHSVTCVLNYALDELLSVSVSVCLSLSVCLSVCLSLSVAGARIPYTAGRGGGDSACPSQGIVLRFRINKMCITLSPAPSSKLCQIWLHH